MISLPVPLPFTAYLLAGMLVAVPLVMWVARLSPAGAGWRVGGWPTLALGVGWGTLLGAGVAGWMWLLLRTGNYLPIPAWASSTDWAMAVAAVPIVEELFFRGALFGSLRRTWSLSWAVILSATADGIVHSAQPWVAVQFAAAVGYALAFRQSGSILTPMLAHAMAVAVLLLTRAYPAAVMEMSPRLLLIAAGVGVALIVIGVVGRSRDKGANGF